MVEFVDRVVARVMRPTVTAGKQPPLASIVAILCPHGLASRMGDDDVRIALLVQGLELCTKLVLINHGNDLRGNFRRIVRTANRVITHIPAERFDPRRQARNIRRGIVGTVVDVANPELRTAFVVDHCQLPGPTSIEGSGNLLELRIDRSLVVHERQTTCARRVSLD